MKCKFFAWNLTHVNSVRYKQKLKLVRCKNVRMEQSGYCIASFIQLRSRLGHFVLIFLDIMSECYGGSR